MVAYYYCLDRLLTLTRESYIVLLPVAHKSSLIDNARQIPSDVAQQLDVYLLDSVAELSDGRPSLRCC